MFGEFGAEFVIDVLVYDESFGGDAALSIVLDASKNRMGYSEVKISVFKDYEGIASTEFEDNFFEMSSCGSCYRASCGGAAGE